ncbi:integrase/recombinase XerC/integrase/recombinase XerD [Methanomicrobium sp. W14]|uniref:site-specific tyrosine recombinase/integron integrase n=1 Tax=Methanomicrobium sp. W14 TaxID=2817839 RepID=UPI001AE83794|nr:site-specific tyrosine recombinase/integron integrase [Methanomicrobium sp. W14]MBP2132879.1 integrase/recombinase XerC/integrase/recombinase XerD [Methanomicrobium sp. W14]
MKKDSFSEWIKRFSYHLKMRNYSPRTIKSYEDGIKRFGHYMWIRRNKGEDDIEAYWTDRKNAENDTKIEVSPVFVNDFLLFISLQNNYKPATLQRIISSLSSFYRFCYAQGAVEANPMIGIDRPKIKEKEIRYLKHNQVLKLLESIQDERDRLIIRTIYATGVRVSELCGIDIENIDFEDHTIRVKGKGGKIRTVFIDDETLDEIEKYSGGKIEGPLFTGQLGKNISPRTVQYIFNKYAPKGITPHKIRHSYASELYKRSKNLRVVQENLGHSSIQTTEIYLHTDVDERKEVYNRFFPLSESGK